MTSPSTALTAFRRLSVIIPVLGPTRMERVSERTLAETAVKSVLSQSDPIGTEVVVVTDLESADLLRDTLRSERVEILAVEDCKDRSELKNRGAASSRGSYLTFLDPRDAWVMGRLSRLEQKLKRHDLVLSTETHLGESNDWFQAFLDENLATPSSLVIHRPLFEQTGGFSKTVGDSEYELTLKAVSILAREGRRERLEVSRDREVIVGERDSMLTLPPGLPEIPGFNESLNSLKGSVKKFREQVAIARLTFTPQKKHGPRVPSRYWGALLRNLVKRR